MGWLVLPHSSPFRDFKTFPGVVRLAVMLYVRFPLSFRNVEEMLHKRGIDSSDETVRAWWGRSARCLPSRSEPGCGSLVRNNANGQAAG